MKEVVKDTCKVMGILLLITIFVGGSVLLAVRYDKNSKARQSRLYALTTKVVELDKSTNKVMCEDSNGNIWSFTEIEDWSIGDCASLLMNDNGTKIIYDDTIVEAHYSAWNLEH